MRCLLSVLAILVSANTASGEFSRDPVAVPDKEWISMTIELPFEEVVRVLNRQMPRCYNRTTGIVGKNTTSVVSDSNPEMGEADWFTEESGTGGIYRQIRVYALDDDTTQVIYTGLRAAKRKLGKQLNGWFAGIDSCKVK